jgi:hypothetical protein
MAVEVLYGRVTFAPMTDRSPAETRPDSLIETLRERSETIGDAS